MLRLRGGGCPSSRGFRGRIRRSGALQEAPSPGPWNPRGGAETPPRPGVCLGFVQGSRGGGPAQAPSEFAPRGRYFAPGENGRPGRPHAATALDGRPARAWPAGQGPSPRPFPAARSSPLRSCARLGPQGFWGREAPSFAPARKGEVQGLASGPQFAEAASGPRFGASLPLPPPPSLPPSPPPLEGTGAWQGPPSGRGRRAGAALPRWARETVWRGGKKGRGRGPRAGTPLFSEG